MRRRDLAASEKQEEELQLLMEQQAAEKEIAAMEGEGIEGPEALDVEYKVSSWARSTFHFFNLPSLSLLLCVVHFSTSSLISRRQKVAT
jgi:hypothetical protein